jgi:hypothetical protein
MTHKRFLNLASIVLLSCFSSAEAHAIELYFTSAKQAFMHLSVTLEEEGGIPYADTKWKIVKADDNLNAFASEEILFQGTTDKKGKVTLKTTQRIKLFSAWDASPTKVWFVYGLRAYRFAVKPENGLYRIEMFLPGAGGGAPVENEDNPKELLASLYTQPEFNSQEFSKEFLDWKRVFLTDLRSFMLQMKKDPDYGNNLLDPEHKEILANAFFNSIDSGEKGLSLRKMIISAAYSTNRRVWPPGVTFVRLISSEQTKPVGYGGQFADSGRNVELWNMVFDDLSRWTQRDSSESPVFSPFSPLQLPPNGITKRNSWPAFVFVRDEHNKLKMYALSAEMSRIINAVFNAQIR